MSDTFDERRVRYLYEAVTYGSIRAAADKLDMNPSVISRQVAQLEAELAIPLLERHGRGVKPTEAGRLLVEYYRQYRSHQEDLISKIGDIRGLARGHVDLISGEGFVADLMGEPLELFWKRYPGVTISVRVSGTNEVVRSVIEDDSQIGLVYGPPVVPGIRSRVATRQPMCAIVRPDHPLARAGVEPVLKRLLDYPVALMEGSYGTRQILQLAEQHEKLRFSPHLTTDSMAVLKHFVRDGHGISILPALAVTQEIDAGQLCAIPIDNLILHAAEAHLITRLGRQLSPAANQLATHLIATMRTFRK